MEHGRQRKLKPCGSQEHVGSNPTVGTMNDNDQQPRRLVVHCKREPFDVYIGRGRSSQWGNPFSDNPQSLAKVVVGDRNEAIARYEEWLLQQPELVARARKELRGKVLGCWCSPRACHGDVLARIANEDGPSPVERPEEP